MTPNDNAQKVDTMTVLHRAIYDLQSRRDGDDYTHIDECARLMTEEDSALAAVEAMAEALKCLLATADFISENVSGAGWRMAQVKARAALARYEGTPNAD